MDENGRGWRGAIERRHARRQAEFARDSAQQRSRMRPTQHGWPAVRTLLTILLVTAAVASLLGWAFTYHEATVLRDEAVQAAGRVDEVRRRSSGPDYAVVRFTARDGRTVSVRVTAWKNLPDEGDRVTVCYTPSAPESHVQDARICPDFATAKSLAITGAAALVLTVAIWVPWLVRRVRRRRSAITDAGGG